MKRANLPRTEMNVGIIAATLPSLKPAFRWLLETAKSLATGASFNNTTSAIHGYKRQPSSVYLKQRARESNHYSSVTGNNPDKHDNCRYMERGSGREEIELNELRPYNVTIVGDERGYNESAKGLDVSSDAILRLEDGQGVESMRIIRTTNVTVMTS